MELANAITLLQEFAIFVQEKQSDDLGDFALWLHKKYHSPSETSVEQQNKNNNLDVYREIGYLLGRINRYSRHYAKSMFSELPISTIEEFWFLNVVFHKKHPTKMEIYEATLTELATGTQMLRRLVELGLLSEEQDATDKRVRRVRITTAGKKVRFEAFRLLGIEARFKMGNLDAQDAEKLLSMLRYLEHFHAQHYRETPQKAMEELLQTYCLS